MDGRINRLRRPLVVYRLPHSGRRRGDSARAFFQISYDAASVGAPSHQGGSHRRKIDRDVLDPGVRKIALRTSGKDDHGLTGLDDGKTFTHRCDDRSSGDREARGRVAREMGDRPSAEWLIVGQCGKSLE